MTFAFILFFSTTLSLAQQSNKVVNEPAKSPSSSVTSPATAQPTSTLRSLLYEVKTPRPVLSNDLLTAKKEAIRYCDDFIREYAAAFIKENNLNADDSPFKTFCKVATDVVNRATTVAALNFAVSRIDERANQTAFFFQSKRMNSFISKYLETDSHNKSLLETVEKSSNQIENLKTQIDALRLRLAEKDKEPNGSVFSFVGLKPYVAQMVESILILFSLCLGLFVLKKMS